MERTPTDRSRVLVALLATLLSAGLYIAGAAPGLTLQHGGSDGGELAVAVYTLGIPHPTGYSTYLLLAQPFRLLPWGTPAGRLNLLSALAAALTVGFVALAAGELFPERRFPARVAALTAGLSLAASGLFWSQALITEVYTLHTLFLALLLWLLLRWQRRGGAGLPLAGLFLGLGLGNHLTLLFLLPGALLFLRLSRRRISRGEGLLGSSLFLAGLAVYLYLPLRAAADPWLNWGDPRDWGAFWAHVSAAAYRGFFFQRPWPEVAGNLAATAGLLLRDFALPGLGLGLAGLFLLGRREGRTLLLLAFPAGLGLLLALTYGGAGSEVHLLPLYLAWALGCGTTAGTLAAWLEGRFGPRTARVALLLPLLSLPLILSGWGHWSLHNDPGPRPERHLEALPPHSLLLTGQDEETFPLWYAQVVEGIRPDVAVVDVRLLEWPWYRRQLLLRNAGLLLPAGAEEGWLKALLQANAGRPIRALSPLPLPEGYSWEPEGAAFRLRLP